MMPACCEFRTKNGVGVNGWSRATWLLPAVAAERVARVDLAAQSVLCRQIGRRAAALESLEDMDILPFTFKDELQEAGESGDFAANRTYPIDHYVRFHRTSGTRGRPLAVLDTLDDWNWWIETWQYVLDAAAVEPSDRVLMAFSFGPFIGFWSAYDAVAARGAMVLPTGAMGSLARLESGPHRRATIMFCTPSYACIWPKWVPNTRSMWPRWAFAASSWPGNPVAPIPAVRRRIERSGTRASSITPGRRKSDRGATRRQPVRHGTVPACT